MNMITEITKTDYADKDFLNLCNRVLKSVQSIKKRRNEKWLQR